MDWYWCDNTRLSGIFLGARCFTQKLLIDPHGVEAIAALAAVLFSKDVGFFDVALQLVQEINTVLLSFSSCGHFIEGIKHELGSFKSYYVTHVKRKANSAAHTLAKAASKEVLNSIWLDDILDSICGIVTRELVVNRYLIRIMLVFFFFFFFYL